MIKRVKQGETVKMGEKMFFSLARNLHSPELPGQLVLREVRPDRGSEILHAQILREVLLSIVHRGWPTSFERTSSERVEKEAKVHPEDPRLRESFVHSR